MSPAHDVIRNPLSLPRACNAALRRLQRLQTGSLSLAPEAGGARRLQYIADSSLVSWSAGLPAGLKACSLAE